VDRRASRPERERMALDFNFAEYLNRRQVGRRCTNLRARMDCGAFQRRDADQLHTEHLCWCGAWGGSHRADKGLVLREYDDCALFSNADDVEQLCNLTQRLTQSLQDGLRQAMEGTIPCRIPEMFCCLSRVLALVVF
jgi:hypothetical protein